jgi:ribosomal protein S18 acetylase RimI-like enzyme
MLTITQANPEQVALVYDIMLQAFEEYRGKLNPPSGVFAETIESVLRVMSEGGALLAWERDVPVGSMRYQFKPDHLYLGRVSVLSSHRGRGIATAMMREVEPIACAHGYNTIRLGARLVLQSNIVFYERLGYRVIDTRIHEKGGSMVVEMLKELSSVH